jgi:uncharacterized protein
MSEQSLKTRHTRNNSIPSRWFQFVQKEQEDREKIRKRILQDVEKTLQLLMEKYTWKEIYLFGSIVQEGRFKPNSDVDIAVLGLNKFDYYTFIGEASEILNRRVDVIRLEECHFSNSIVKKGLKWIHKKK